MAAVGELPGLGEVIAAAGVTGGVVVLGVGVAGLPAGLGEGTAGDLTGGDGIGDAGVVADGEVTGDAGTVVLKDGTKPGHLPQAICSTLKDQLSNTEICKSVVAF